MPTAPLAWWTMVTSYAKDFQTVITKGRCSKWKNIHKNAFGVHYAGAYGSQNEDFYHRQITGTSYKHFGEDFRKYPYEIAYSGLQLNHYCELKSYGRRLEKMKHCLQTQNPQADAGWVEESAVHHPRVTLEPTSSRFGQFEFTKADIKPPDVFETYRDEFAQFKKEVVNA
jgi:hypothetical protein